MDATTAERLRELLDYDPETGVFRYRHRILSRGRPSARAGRIAGHVEKTGSWYVRINVDGGAYYAHRLAWLYMTGEWPPDEIDHANLDRSDNRWANLRLATRLENGRNLGLSIANRTGLKGVAVYRDNLCTAQIHLNHKKYHLGVFDCKAAAHFAYLVAAIKLHGEFARAR